VASFVAVLSLTKMVRDGDSSAIKETGGFRLAAVEINSALQVIFTWLFLVLKETELFLVL